MTHSVLARSGPLAALQRCTVVLMHGPGLHDCRIDPSLHARLAAAASPPAACRRRSLCCPPQVAPETRADFAKGEPSSKGAAEAKASAARWLQQPASSPLRADC